MLVVVFPCCHVLELTSWSRHLVNILCSSADSVMHPGVVRGVLEYDQEHPKSIRFQEFCCFLFTIILSFLVFYGRISCIHSLMLYDL